MRRGAALTFVLLTFLCGCPNGKPAGELPNAPTFDSPALDHSGERSTAENNQASADTSTQEQRTTAGNSKSLSPANEEALSVLTKDHFLAAKLNVEKIRNEPLVKKLPQQFDEMLSQAIEEQLGQDFGSQVAELETLFVAASPGSGRFADFGLFFRQGIRRAELLEEEGLELPLRNAEFDNEAPSHEQIAPDAMPELPLHLTIYARFKTEKAVGEFRDLYLKQAPSSAIKYAGGEYFKTATVPTWFYFGKRFIVIASQEELIKAAIDHAGKAVRGPLCARLAKMNLNDDLVAVGLMGPIRQSLQDALAKAEGVPPQVTMTVEKLDAFSLAVDLAAKQLFQLDAQAVDKDGAKMLTEMINGLRGLGNIVLSGLMRDARDHGAPPESLDTLKFAQRMLGQMLVQQDNAQFSISLIRPQALDEVVEKNIALAVEARKRMLKAEEQK